jgi:hypothetical protein
MRRQHGAGARARGIDELAGDATWLIRQSLSGERPNVGPERRYGIDFGIRGLRGHVRLQKSFAALFEGRLTFSILRLASVIVNTFG